MIEVQRSSGPLREERYTLEEGACLPFKSFTGRGRKSSTFGFARAQAVT
jgi:hypothetical protein